MKAKDHPDYFGEAICPGCKASLDCSHCVSPGDDKLRPKPKDLTVCVYCLTVLEYGHELELRKVSIDKFVKLSAEIQGQLMSTIKTLQRMKKEKNEN